MASRGRDDKPVSKAEFVGLMAVLGQKDRETYRKLRELGWNAAIPLESDCPN
jgi:hypothetical protein